MGVDPEPQQTRPLSDEPTPKHLTPGRTLASRYLVENVIGIGGMGSVYQARDLHFPSIKKIVAVKEMANQVRDPSSQEAFIRNFEREANTIASLNHPAIPRIYDFFEEGDSAYLVLEFIYGKDLELIINETGAPLPEAQVLAWALQLCEVLNYLHTHKPEPIIFRDIKPSNIMINAFNKVVLVDFGIAKAFRMGQKATMMGTEGYSPPEQYRGEVSPCVDIYAVGATLHHLLTNTDPQNEPPFSFPKRPIEQYQPGVSPELIAIIDKALAYESKDRFQSIAEMREALQAVARSENLAQSSPLTPSFRRPEIAPIWSFECADEVRGTPAYDNGMVYVGSLDGSLYALEAETGSLVWKFATGGGIVGRPVVQDRFVYFGSEDQFLYVLSAGTGKELWRYRTDGRVRSSPCVSRDYLYIGSDDGYLHAVSLRTGSRLWRFLVGSPIRSTPCAAENRVYFGAESGDVYCLDMLGKPKWHFHARRAVTSSPVYRDGCVYFGSMDATLYAIEAVEGWESWRGRMDKGSISTPCTANGLLFTGAIDGQVYAFDLFTRREVWRYQTGHQVTGSPVIYSDFLFCGSVDGNLYCLDYRTGKEIWKFLTGKPITGSPVIANESVFFGSTDQRVYALPAQA